MNKKRTLKKVTDFWLKAAEDNFQIATIMLKTGRYSFSMFMCQQSLEALLKAVIIVRTKTRPPYVHELGILLKAARLKVPSRILAVLKEADQHYIKTRYKEDRFNAKIYNKESATRLIKNTDGAIRWFTRRANLSL